MKNNGRRFFLYAIFSFALLLIVSIAVLWLFDNAMNGMVINFLESFVSGVNQSDAIMYDRNSIAKSGFMLLALASAILTGACTFCAYCVYRKQHALLVKAQDEAEKAKTLAEREAQRKSDLITYLAHDLKTPLSSVIAYLSLLSESPELVFEQRAKYTGIALDKAYRLEQLIGELFEIIRFNLQTIIINNDSINLKLMLMQLADEFYPVLLQNRKTIRVQCEEELIIRGDSDKLARVFGNVLKNALIYSYAETEIAVEVLREKDTLRIIFSNEGAPIPAEKLKLIFEKFYRLDESRSTKTGGSGLGLAIAKEIVEAHQGTISAESNEACTCFVISLPVARLIN